MQRWGKLETVVSVPERAKQIAQRLVLPFQGEHIERALDPRALPGAGMLRPFQGKDHIGLSSYSDTACEGITSQSSAIRLKIGALIHDIHRAHRTVGIVARQIQPLFTCSGSGIASKRFWAGRLNGFE